MREKDSPEAAAAKRLLAAARRLLANREGPDFLASLAADLFVRTPPEDLAVYTSAEITAFVDSAAGLLAARPNGRHLIQVDNPAVEGRGKRHGEITLIQ